MRQLLGTASGTVRAADGTRGDGFATVAYPIPRVTDGTAEATVDRSIFLAFAGEDNAGVLSRAELIIDGDDFSDAVVGEVRTKEFDTSPGLILTAEIADERLAYHHPQTISKGAKSVVCTFEIGPPGNIKRWTAFRGHMSAAPNDEPLLPHATITAKSLCTELLDKRVCIQLAAHAGFKRGEILTAAATKVGLMLANDFGGREITKQIDYDDTFGRLLSVFCELEGWTARERLDCIDVPVVELITGTPFSTIGTWTFAFAPVYEDGSEGPALESTPYDLSNDGSNVFKFSKIVFGSKVDHFNLYAKKVEGTPSQGLAGGEWGLLVRINDFGIHEQIVNTGTYESPAIKPINVVDGNGLIEIREEAQLCDENALFDFSENDGVSSPLQNEDPPASPVTKYVFSGTQPLTDSGQTIKILGDPSIGQGSVIYITRDSGITIAVDQYDYTQVGTSGPEVTHFTKKTFSYPNITGGTPPSLYSARATRTTAEEVTQKSLTSTTYEQLTRTYAVVTWIWDPDKCYATTKTTDTTTSNSDGDSWRREDEYWPIVTVNQTQRITTVRIGTGLTFDPGLLVVAYTAVDTWIRNGSSWTHSLRNTFLPGYITGITGDPTLVPADADDTGSGDLPVPGVAAGPDDILIEQAAFVLPIEIAGTGYLELQEEDDKLAAFAEDVDELRKVALRRARRGFAVKYQISSFMIPFIRVADVTSLSNYARYLDMQYGWLGPVDRWVRRPMGESGMDAVTNIPPPFLRVVS